MLSMCMSQQTAANTVHIGSHDMQGKEARHTHMQREAVKKRSCWCLSHAWGSYVQLPDGFSLQKLPPSDDWEGLTQRGHESRPACSTPQDWLEMPELEKQPECAAAGAVSPVVAGRLLRSAVGSPPAEPGSFEANTM